ncbi:MAG: peptide deformylase [bacterium]|nr:peptide deformylase [bacterium]
MKIYKTENVKEDKFLHTKTKEVDLGSFDKEKLRKIIRDMRKTMVEADGIGLAGNQVGLDLRLFVARDNGKFYAVINPKITKTFGHKYETEEGCLSVPGFFGETKRYPEVMLEGQNQSGKKLRFRADGLLAHIFQHEVDHLDGIVYVDHAKNVYEHAKSERLKEKEGKNDEK